jgi:hypothetical protein
LVAAAGETLPPFLLPLCLLRSTSHCSGFAFCSTGLWLGPHRPVDDCGRAGGRWVGPRLPFLLCPAVSGQGRLCRRPAWSGRPVDVEFGQGHPWSGWTQSPAVSRPGRPAFWPRPFRTLLHNIPRRRVAFALGHVRSVSWVLLSPLGHGRLPWVRFDVVGKGWLERTGGLRGGSEYTATARYRKPATAPPCQRTYRGGPLAGTLMCEGDIRTRQ